MHESTGVRIMTVGIKRVYEPAEENDGYRVLVDRLWPRGASKERAAVDLWAKEIAPSDDLRKWFSHDPSRWEEFRKRYRDELSTGDRKKMVKDLVSRAGKGRLTLVYAAKDTTHNNAIVLQEVIRSSYEDA
jgi:uncharacterized protein YeaO (DUF488 family)